MNSERLPSGRRNPDAGVPRRRPAPTAGPRPRDHSVPTPLSYSQLRIWFLQQWEPDAPTFNAARALRLLGELDAAALERALAGLVARHESLRTVFRAERDGEPRQVVLDPDGFEMPLVDLRGELETQREGRLHRLLRELSREPFDLASDLMLRATLVRLAEQEHVLLLRMHHVAGDAASVAVMYSELGALYEACRAGRPHGLPDPEIQFPDFAVWQRQRLRGPLLERLTAYWVGQLEGAPPLLALPTDRPRREVQRHEGAHRHFSLPPAVAERIDALAREERATMYIVALAAFATMLYRLSGQDDVVVGSPIANRTHSELAGLVGFLSNTVALRVRLGGNPSFREVVRRTRGVALGAYAHQEMPFEQVVAALKLPRDPGHNPLFQVNFRAQATPPPVPELIGVSAQPLTVDIGYSRFDLALELQSGPDALSGYFEYDLDLFDTDSIDGFVEVLGALLDQVLANPDIPVLALKLPVAERGRQPRGPGRPSPRDSRRPGAGSVRRLARDN